MKTSPLQFKISRLRNGAEGTNETIEFDEKVEFDPNEINAVTNLTGELMLVKLKNEISAMVTDAEITVIFTCNKCLKEFKQTISIPNAEREFYEKKPHDAEDITDVYLIDLKNLTIDLTEMMRQEIILHFPFIPVCSESCKGICQSCGADLNKKKCQCKAEEVGNKPFKDLKKITTAGKTRKQKS